VPQSFSRPRHLPFVALGLSIVLGVAGQILMKWGAMASLDHGVGVVALLKLGLAVGVYSLGVLNWIVALRAVPLSIAYPISSLTYIGVLLGSYGLFSEHISGLRITGVALVFAGVLLVVLGARTRGARSATPDREARISPDSKGLS
jgi:multidrug transporter EmrE-like cation transporter